MSVRIVILITLILFTLPALGLAQDIAPEGNTVHVVQPGENLFRIALNYGLTTDQVAAANGITDPTRIYSGQSLIIPNTDGPMSVEVVEEVAEPETEATIIEPEAEQPEATIIEASPQAAVEVAAVSEEVEPETRPVYHTIQRGETLRAIAQANGTTEEDLIALNSITNPNRILAGQQLLIRNEVVTSEEATIDPAAPVVIEYASQEEALAAADASEFVTHTVQNGEYLSSIARRYSVTNDMILAANSIADPNTLYAGQELVIPAGLEAEEIEAVRYAPPSATVGTGREIVVDLSNSRVYAFEDGILMYEAVSSNGLPATPTVQGKFTVRTKVRSQTMSGPGYWLPNVEWVMYFYQGYALHGAYWHDNWGQPMSHGCVNLRNEDARWFYDFAEVGTPVTVQV